MTHEEILRELASLPPEAQRQVADFIAFLRARHKHSQAPEKSERSDLAQDSFNGIWRDREDMQDINEQIALMATDPEIQSELQNIEREFSYTEGDGLEEV